MSGRFNSLKEALIQAPILKHPDFTPSAKPFQLHTDASATGIGAVLEQSAHVISYASRALANLNRITMSSKKSVWPLYML